jgi:hypothetical protein
MFSVRGSMGFLKKNWYLVVPAVLIATPVLMILYTSAVYGYSFSEAAACVQAVGQSDTKFQTMNYSEGRFRRLQPGIMGRDVFEAVGMPLERHDDDTKWHYSLPVGGSLYFHERTVLLEKGRVTNVICRFHTPESK